VLIGKVHTSGGCVQRQANGACANVGSAINVSSTSSSGGQKARSALNMGCSDANLLRWVGEHLEASNALSDKIILQISLPESRGGRNEPASFKRYLRNSSVDFVVCADQGMTAEIPDDLVLAAVLPRREVHEAVVTKAGTLKSLVDLPSGATVCVASTRCRLQLQARFPHLDVVQSRAALQKRLRRLHSGDYDACVTSTAALQHWGFGEAFGDLHLLDFDEVMPAFGQGAVGLICSADDEATAKFLAKFDDPPTRTCIESETALVSRLELLGGAVAGGLAQLDPDGQLQLKCTLARPGHNAPFITSAERHGNPEDFIDMARAMAKELAGETVQRLMVGVATQQGAQEALLDEEQAEDSDSEDDRPADNKALPPLSGMEERLQVDVLDTTGVTRYEGRVCTVFPLGAGVLVDVNCEAPARWYPEQAEDGPRLLELGTEVSVYCCRWQWQVFAVFEQPPRLLQRGSVERLTLDELSPGQGPFRAVVISCTAQGILVDFNCEVAGRLVSNRPHTRGEELRVYCQEADAALGTCTVSTRRQRVVPRKRLHELPVGSDTAFKGVVRRITGGGALVDFHCEVMGYVGAMDMDIDALPDGLTLGHEVTTYITSVDVTRRRVGLSMFRPRPGSAVGLAAASASRGSPPPRGQRAPGR